MTPPWIAYLRRGGDTIHAYRTEQGRAANGRMIAAAEHLPPQGAVRHIAIQDRGM
ncbi:hypothetical protein [Selenomonas sp. FOBRC9]|uniref:hypothetical protein n=1 Tax=Selenomonas sp. FOBRC9 TaxID=936573 RepID=UPI0003092A9E|nr:hypothetical protein [Selenomonas sp. FOBRC9]